MKELLPINERRRERERGRVKRVWAEAGGHRQTAVLKLEVAAMGATRGTAAPPHTTNRQVASRPRAMSQIQIRTQLASSAPALGDSSSPSSTAHLACHTAQMTPSPRATTVHPVYTHQCLHCVLYTVLYFIPFF